MSRSRKAAYLALRDKLLKKTMNEADPYRRMVQAYRTGEKIMDRQPGQGPDVERALFHVAAMLAREV